MTPSEAIEEAKALAEMLPVHVMRLANSNINMSQFDWNEISNDILSASRALAALSEPTKGMSTAEIDAGMMAEASLADACAKVDWGYYGVTEEERAIQVRDLTDSEKRATVGYPNVGQMNAYYYSFEPTGVPAIDAILGAIGSAGKGSHHTESWDEEHGSDEFAFSYIDRIQGAALLAAKDWVSRGALSPTLRSQSVPEGWVCVPKEAPEELLISMAIRDDHALAIRGYYDQPIFSRQSGPTHKQRFDAAIRAMRQIHEEVVGKGFYSPETAARYRQYIPTPPANQEPET
jgi:hypothetical protein